MAAGSKVLEYIIGAKDDTAKAIDSAVSNLKRYYSEFKTTFLRQHEDYTRMKASAVATYETLDQINKRADGIINAKKAQDDHNAALERYCRLVDQAAARERARMLKLRGYNAFDPSTFKNLEKLHGGTEGIKGAKEAEVTFGRLAATAKKTAPAVAAVSSSLGMMGGTAGKVAQCVSAISSMAMAFGPLGAAIAGAQAALTLFFEHANEEVEKFTEKVRAMSEKVQERLNRTKETKFDRLTREMSRTADMADRMTESFERAAKAEADLAKADAMIKSKQGDAELADMERQKTKDVGNASEETRSSISAEWDVKIAKRKAELAEEEARTSKQMELDAIKTDEERLALAEKNYDILSRASEEAYKKYREVKEIFGRDGNAPDEAYVKKFEELWRAAGKRAKVEHDKIKDIQNTLATSRKELEANDIERDTAVKRAQTNVMDAQNQHKKALDDEQKHKDNLLKQDEEKRLRMEERLARERERLMREEIRNREKELNRLNNLQSQAQRDLTAAQDKARQAWGWYRDKDSLKAQLEEEKAEAAAQKQFEKDFAKLKDHRRDWRTADNLSLDDEAVRRVGLAREAEAEAQKRLDEIAENTRELADKIEELLTMEE